MSRGRSYRSINPMTGVLLADTAPLCRAEAEAALDRLGAAATAWAQRPLASRLDGLASLGRALRARRSGLAETMGEELGKLRAEAEAEVDKAAACVDAIIDIAPGALAARYLRLEAVDAWIEPAPRGPVLGIMPANYPIWQAVRCLVPNLAVGNGALIKPAPQALRSSMALRAALEEAGLIGPAELLPLAEEDVLWAIEHHPVVQGVVVVGGEVAGSVIGAAAGRARKKVVLELGGSDAYVVLADADLALAARTVLQSRLKNAGQACLSAKRVIVDRRVLDVFLDTLLPQVDAVRFGGPADPAARLGPLLSVAARERLHAQVQASVAAGAALLRGGAPLPGPSAGYALTVLCPTPPGCPAANEELFGPVIAVQVADDEEHALWLADQGPFGLGAALFSGRGAAALQLAHDRLHAGTVALNGPATSDPRLPFGGLRGSGHGVELGEAGLLEFTARRVLRAPRDTLEPLRLDRMGWSFVHPASVVDALRGANEADLSDYDRGDAAALKTALAKALSAPEDRLTLTHGGEDALLKLLLLGRAEGRAALLIPAWSWPTYAEMGRSLGYAIHTLPLRRSRTAEGGGACAAALDDWMQALRANPQAVLLVGSPNNPTGHGVSAAEICALRGAAPQVRIIVDGVYQPLLNEMSPLGAEGAGLAVIGSMSTLFGLPGLRVGFVVGALPAALGLSLGLSPSALRTCRAALGAKDRYADDQQRAVAAAARLGGRAGRRWRTFESAAGFVMATLDDDLTEADLDRAEAEAGLRGARLCLTDADGAETRALRWTLGSPDAEAALRRFLDALDRGT